MKIYQHNLAGIKMCAKTNLVYHAGTATFRTKNIDFRGVEICH